MRIGAFDNNNRYKSYSHLAAISGFFGIKVIVGFGVVVASARLLSVSDFAEFSQLFLLFSLLSTIGAGGVQHGLIRQVAAANERVGDTQTSILAAILVWAATSIISIFVLVMSRDYISTLLIGSTDLGWAIPWLAALTAVSGGGVIYTSVLTGQRRVPKSMLLQALGIGLGAGCCFCAMRSGMVGGAVLWFATGPALISMIVGLPIAKKLIGAKKSIVEIANEMRILIGFSCSFLITATIMPLALLVMRYLYRDAFGMEYMGFWIAGNRVSDVTSQLIGLYMIQIFLPGYSKNTTKYNNRRLVKNTAIVSAGAAISGLVVFLAFPIFWVDVFLSEKFRPAIPFIVGYLSGDVLRVGASIAAHAALAKGRLLIYVGIEVSAAIIFSTLVIAMIAMNRVEAPYIAYPLTYALLAIVSFILLRRLNSSKIASLTTRRGGVAPKETP